MLLSKEFLNIGEYGAAGMYEEPDRSLFYRKALGIRRFYENCKLAEYHSEYLYPSGVLPTSMNIQPFFLDGMNINFNYDCIATANKELADIFVKDYL